MERKSVDSSNIKAVTYDDDLHKLRVEFHSNATYEYDDVPKEVVDELINASSIGKHFGSEIKDKYKFTKVR